MHVSEAKRLKALEAENAKLKKLLAEQPMNVSTLKGYRQRRACGLVGINPRVYRQLPTRSEDADLRGYPCMMVAHNGTERTSNAILKWQENRKVKGPPKPEQSYLMNEDSQRSRPHPKNLRADCLIPRDGKLIVQTRELQKLIEQSGWASD